MRFFALLALLLAAPVVASAAAPAPVARGAPVRLAAHRALYRLTLADGRGQVIGASGTMGYEVTDACTGWKVRQRLDLTLTNTEGQTVRMVSDYATLEAKDGTRLEFQMKQTTDGAVSAETQGKATLDRPGGPGVAEFTLPRPMQKLLPAGTLFPMAHTAAVIRAAEAGQRFLTLPVFDGTDDAGAELSAIVATGTLPPERTAWPVLSALPSVRVEIAFFGVKADKMLPDYAVGMRYWTNGVADDLRMDFGDFVMHGKLVAFEPLPSRC